MRVCVPGTTLCLNLPTNECKDFVAEIVSEIRRTRGGGGGGGGSSRTRKQRVWCNRVPLQGPLYTNLMCELPLALGTKVPHVPHRRVEVKKTFLHQTTVANVEHSRCATAQSCVAALILAATIATLTVYRCEAS